MKRINLQLFAKDMYDDKEIVDYLNGQGQDSSYESRKQIAESIGIKNYTGLTEQNQSLLKALQTKQSQNSGNNVSLGAKNSQSSANAYTGSAKGGTNNAGIIGQSTWDAINTPFTASSAYTEAMKYTNGLLEQLSSGRTSYTDQIDSLMSEIISKDKFEYDADSDALFQQALASAMFSGKTAMQDTIGQASALTGGYGSTYATTAGNHAYNAYIQDAYASIPDYYQLALEAYQMEGQEMYDQLAMLSNADATEYGRLYDSWNANFANAQNMYNQEYGAWQDSVSNALNMANLQMQEQAQAFDQAYRTYVASQKPTKMSDEPQAGDGGEKEVELKEPTSTQLQAALEAYNSGGDAALNQYVDSLSSNIDMDMIYTYIFGDGDSNPGYGVLPLHMQNWTIKDDTFNGMGGDDHNDTYSYGDSIMTFDQLVEMIAATDLTEEEQEAFLNELRKQSKR